jgi:hypothetical protein
MSNANEDILTQLTTQPNARFEQVFQNVQHPQKAVTKKILVYFDKVIDHLLVKEERNEIECIHLHIPMVIKYLKDVILEFLTIKLFYLSLEQDRGQSDYIQNRLHSLNLRIENCIIPSDASAAKGNKAYRKWIEQKEGFRKEKYFISSIPDISKGLFPSVILNTLIHEKPVVENTLFATTVSQLKNNKRAYILHNTERFSTLIGTLHLQGVLQNIRDIVLFDCTGRTLFNACNKVQLEQYKDEDVYIRNLIVVSFGKEPFRLKQLINNSNLIYQNHFNLPPNAIPNKTTYIFQGHEIKQLLEIKIPQKKIMWVNGADEEVKNYWQLIETLDLPQLSTIYVFNIFSVATTIRIAYKIIEHLFNGRDNDHIFKDEVHEVIAELIDDEKNELKNAVTNLLKKIVDIWDSSKKNLLRAMQHKSSIALVVPHSFMNDVIFHNEMRYFLSGVGFKMYSWKDIKKGEISDRFILSFNYRDTGKYPFNIFPNILENNINGDTFFLSCFLSAFFSRRYAQCEQEYNAQLSNKIKNNFRRKYLGQQDSEIVSAPLREGMSFDEMDDQDDDLIDAADTVTVTYDDNSHSTFYPSKMLIVQRVGDHSFKVIRADELFQEECKDYKIQPLENLYENLNLFEIRPEEEEELKAMKLVYHVVDSYKVLWKVLLARKRPEVPDEVLYEHVGKAIGDDRFVRYQYFREEWLDPGSDLLIPRRRRHFRAICEYLELPPSYYRLELKKSASKKWSKRYNTKRTNRLLTQMFNEGMFENSIDWSNIKLGHLLMIHDLEGNGITEENVRTELHALVALLKENISLRVVLNAVCSADAQ